MRGGAPEEGGVIICSEFAHYSVSKAVGVLGLGTANLIAMPTTGALKLDTAALAATLDSLALEGRRVIAIIAVAGTTEAGAFDPIRQMAALARAHGAWLHVDAAWGGGLLFASPEFRRKAFDGIELADSVTIDAHKQLFSPIGFGMLIFREPHSSEAIAKQAEYVIRRGSADVGKFCLEGTRPGVALHLHATLHALGADGLASVMELKLENTRRIAASIAAAPDFELLLPPESDILLFRYVPEALRRAAAAPGVPLELDEAREAALDLWQVRLLTGHEPRAEKRRPIPNTRRLLLAPPWPL